MSVPLREKSLTPEDLEEEEEDEDEERPRRKKAKKGKEVGGKEYRYSSEIGQMMFVFGEVQEPLAETVKLVEDIVRGQIIEIVTRARLLTHIRSSRYLSPEDLIFLIRNDRGKVNRLRTYLSWKDVRKRAKEDTAVDPLDIDDDDKQVVKRKAMVKLPWEVLTAFQDLRDDEEEDDEDEVQAHHDSMQRLRDADEVTRRMTRDEYVHFSECRQASFTYRKAKRFREFVNFGAYLDVRPNDEIVDILGFLAFEMVRSLCVTALAVRERMTTNTEVHTKSSYPISLFAPPPSARQPLLPAHVLEAFAQIQREQAGSRGGLRNFRSGVSRGRMALV